jgi:tRNA(fMet)-specific endonuclease VapC
MKFDSSSKPVLIDTDVLSYIFNEHSLAANYQQLLEGRQGFVALQTLGEMRFGAFLDGWGTKRLQNLEDFLTDYTLIEPSNSTSGYWAKLRVQVRRIGRHIARSDAWIAATALEHDLALVTHNVKDFEAVEGLQIISLNPKLEKTKKP